MIQIIILLLISLSSFSSEKIRLAESRWSKFEAKFIKDCQKSQIATENLSQTLAELNNCKKQFRLQNLAYLHKLNNKELFVKKALKSKNLASFLKDQYFNGSEDKLLIKIMIYEISMKISNDKKELNAITADLLTK